MVGGETCDDTYSPENDCENSGKAQTEMRTMHYSFLNCAYNNDVNDDWERGGCMDAIKKNLGYRLVLINAVFPKQPVKAGMQLAFSLTVENKGYASPYNRSSNEEFVFTINTDIRRWYSGSHLIAAKITTDAGMPSGEYDLLLSLPDASESLAKRPEYAIRLANDNMWEAQTGYNYLNRVISIN